MSEKFLSQTEIQDRLPRWKQQVAQIPERAKRLLDGGANGVQAAAAISESTDQFVVQLFLENLSGLSPSQSNLIQQKSAVVAVGGSGRGEMAPYSDVDLLFLYQPSAHKAFAPCVAQFVRDCWDAGLKLGHSIRTVAETVSMARYDAEIATALVEARRLWGSEPLVEQLKHTFYRRVVRGRIRAFVDDCVAARERERLQHGAVVQQLEPDIKRSSGGLRDVHLIRWVGFAHLGTSNISMLRLQGALGMDDARNLVTAHEFLTRIRFDLHLHAGKPQEVLTRDEQLRLAAERKIESSPGQREVERFMQEYFQHSALIADVSRRFVSLNRPKSFLSRIAASALTRRVEGMYLLCGNRIDVVDRYRDTTCCNLSQILKLYELAARRGVELEPQLAERIQQSVSTVVAELTLEDARRFLSILGLVDNLRFVLRSMWNTGVLERIIPELRRVRCLLQFNQYHSYTVDEHSLRAVEAALDFQDDAATLGEAYRDIQQKGLLILSLLLHDAGKGLEQDHSEIGRRIAESVAERLFLSEQQREALVFLVHKHLKMSHLAFRRDISDPEVVDRFCHEVGSPETLRMLYALTAADLIAVGPGVWTEWKAELLANLFQLSLHAFSGRQRNFDAGQRLETINQSVRALFCAVAPAASATNTDTWLDEQLRGFSPQYLKSTAPKLIAADLAAIQHLEARAIVVDGANDAETGTVDFRIIADAHWADGCFHRIAGVLTAKRLNILSAQIATSRDGIAVDAFRVVDNDFSGTVPQHRIDEIAEAIRRVLTKEMTVKQLFQRNRRFDARKNTTPVSDLKARVWIDNDGSDRCTIIDVFAHDRPGLLYTISRTVFELKLSVLLAKIATHFDQVLDVFYVTDLNGAKITDPARLAAIRQTLDEKLVEFESEGHLQFVA